MEIKIARKKGCKIEQLLIPDLKGVCISSKLGSFSGHCSASELSKKFKFCIVRNLVNNSNEVP